MSSQKISTYSLNQTYLLRQIINADVEGCAGLASFGFDVDGVAIVAAGGIVLSEGSLPFWPLFFFFAMIAICN
jgi:hypothetical protein